MKKKLNITALVDKWTIPAQDPEFREKQKDPITEYYVIRALRELGHNVTILGSDEDEIANVTTSLSKEKPDLVFNLTEALGGNRCMDMNIAAVLEMLDIPFTGSGPAGLMLCRDKRLCKQLLTIHRIRVPNFISTAPNQKVRVPKSLHFPLVVKPAFEDSSEGISNASLVTHETSLLERVKFVHEGWDQPVISEEYIEGQELYVGIIGNKHLKVLPIRECFFAPDNNEGPHLTTYRVKWNEEYRKKLGIRFGFAKLDDDTVKNIERTCKKIYRLLQLRDYGRIDIRLTPEKKIIVLEVNPNADIGYGDEIAEAAEKAGVKYEKLIDHIVHLALGRYQ
ncbi:MAG: ATP-grasp domain-containing protein [Sedimentisphaerales bacterium]|nr:ATP-grasp domain-containing protein [Sedimentisphaerales bacterium]